MDHEWDRFAPTRRSLLTMAAGAGIAGWVRLYGSSPDFWNKKEPAEWSAEEIEHLTTKSPWSKEVNAQASMDRDQSGGGYPGGGGGGYPGGGGGYPGGGGGYPGGGGMGGPRGGMGIPGMGGGGTGGGAARGGRGRSTAESYNGTVRW